jgi:uncharacterized protein
MTKKWMMMAAAGCALLLAAPPLRAQEPTPERQAAARELIAAVGDSANFYRGFYRGLFEGMRHSLSPADSAAVMPALRAWVGKYLAWRDLEPEYVRLYASLYTEEQMRDIAAFFRTPTGRRVSEVAPELVVRTSAIAQSRVAAHVSELTAAVAQAVSASGGAAKP